MIVRRKVFSNNFESDFQKALNEKKEREAFEVAARESGNTPWVVAPGKETEWAEDEYNAMMAKREAAEKKEKMTKGALVGAGVAAVGAAGYGAYKAWKNKKRAAKKAAEEKYKKD